MKLNGVEFDADKIAAFCRRHGVSRLSVFGSILRDDFRADSDVDVLVEFLPTTRASLVNLGGMLMKLRDMLGREVDLRTPADLSKYFRGRVVVEARPLYAASVRGPRVTRQMPTGYRAPVVRRGDRSADPRNGRCRIELAVVHGRERA